MAHITEHYFNETVQTLVKTLQFDSSMKAAEDNYPFGKETADCLQYFLDVASSMGFTTKNYDNYVGEVVYGKGEPFALLAHLDVVPAGNGWKYNAFGGVINDDISAGGVPGTKIWGRGAMDDKGPAVCLLYALKALKDEGFMPNRTIKLILGCNEESGWKCIEHYNKVAVMPEEGFTPDANFPVIYAEKGILHVTLSFPIQDAPFTALCGGERANMVCDLTTAFITKRCAQSLAYYQNTTPGTRLSYDNSTNALRCFGKSAHGSTPHRGANALQGMLAFLSTVNTDCKRAYEILFDDVLGLTKLQDETGNLTFSPNVSTYQNGVLQVTADIRFPATEKKETILQMLDNAGISYTVQNYQAPLYNDPNSELISTLNAVYGEVTGKTEKPIAIGGGTYARALARGCAFGPEVDGEEDTIHQANEYITFDKIRSLSKIYYEAIKRLTKPKTICIGKFVARSVKK